MNGHTGEPASDSPRTHVPIHRLIVAASWVLIAAGPLSAHAQQQETTMQINRSGTLVGKEPPEATFTGDVRISGYFQRESPSRLSGATVTFAPGARTPWKVNPAGQTVVVTGGVGWAQVEGEAIIEIRTGDVIWFPPGQSHWEGATPDHVMTYVAVQEGGVQFRESVTDEEYRSGPPAS